MKKILLGLFAITILLVVCDQINNPGTAIQTFPNANYVFAQEFEPNYVSTLNAQGTQTSDVKNIFRLGKVNNSIGLACQLILTKF